MSAKELEEAVNLKPIKHEHTYSTISRRDNFICAAVSGLCAKGATNPDYVSKIAIAIADETLKESDKKK